MNRFFDVKIRNVTITSDDPQHQQETVDSEQDKNHARTENAAVYPETTENAFSDAAEETAAFDANADALRNEIARLRRENERLNTDKLGIARTVAVLQQENNELRARIAAGLPQSAAVGRNDRKSEIESGVMQMERNLISILDGCRRDLGGFRDSLEKTLYDMRFEIYEGDFALLAGAYQKLFDYVMNVLPLMGNENGSDREMIAVRLSRHLHTLQEGLIKAGLEVISPKEGELYDPNEHAAANASNLDDTENIPIVSVVYPGFKKGNYVICRAAVNVALPY